MLHFCSFYRKFPVAYFYSHVLQREEEKGKKAECWILSAGKHCFLSYMESNEII